MEKNGGKPVRTSSRSCVLPAIVLAALFAVAFLVRAAAWGLPALQPRERAFFQDEAGDPYLREMDSYFYLRHAEEMKETGKITWSVRRGEDPLNGPRGGTAEGSRNPLGLSVLAWAVWRILRWIPGVTLTRVAIWLGPAAGSLAVIPAFCFTRRRTNLFGGIAAGVLAGCAIPFVYRTHAGFFDTDLVLALLPLAAVTGMIRCLEERDRRRQAGYALGSALAFGGLYLCWSMYYAYALAGIAAAALTTGLVCGMPGRFLRNAGENRKTEVLRGGALAAGATAVLLLILGGGEILGDLSGAAGLFLSLRGNTDALPSVYAYTSELKASPLLPGGSPVNLLKANLNSVLGMIGGGIPALLAALAIPLGIVAARARRGKAAREEMPEAEAVEPGEPRDRPADGAGLGGDPVPIIAEICFLGGWAAAGIYLASTGIRFGEIAALPTGQLAGLAVGRLFWTAGKVKPAWGRRAALAACGCLLAASLFPTLHSAGKAAKSFAPMVTDSTAGAMDYIRQETPEDAAILSWWDYGYFMEQRAGRRTLADGGSDSGALNWFLAKALLTEDPRTMTGIARMLNESGTEVLDALTAAGMEQGEAADLLLRIVRTDRAAAERILEEEGLDPVLAERTHPADSNEILLVLGTDLLGKIQALSYFAGWDPVTRSPGETAFSITSTASAVPEEGGAELTMNAKGYTLRLREEEDGGIRAEYTKDGDPPRIPCRTVVWENGIRVQDQANGTDGLAAVLLREDGRYCGILCTEQLCDSMLMRMLAGEDAALPEATLLGTWYGDREGEPSDAQRRIRYGGRPAWARQVWRINLE